MRPTRKKIIFCLLCGLFLGPAAHAGLPEALVAKIIEQIMRGDYDVSPPPQIPAPNRIIPESAEYGVMVPPVGRQVRIDGEAMMLSPGAKIRNMYNRIILPGTLIRPVTVRYTQNLTGQVHRVWIITPAEDAR